MSQYNDYSRARRHRRRKSSKKRVFLFISLAIVFCVFLFSLIAFGNKEKDNKVEKSQAELAIEGNEDLDHTDTDHPNDKNGNEDKKLDEEDIQNDNDLNDADDTTIVKVNSDDDNVIQAYEGDWEPVGTSQTGSHTTDYGDGSLDRQEIKKAIAIVTGIQESDVIEYWVGNGGDQKVEATVSDTAKENYFRVYLSWIDKEGWQAYRVERLKGYEKNKQTKT